MYISYDCMNIKYLSLRTSTFLTVKPLYKFLFYLKLNLIIKKYYYYKRIQNLGTMFLIVLIYFGLWSRRYFFIDKFIIY